VTEWPAKWACSATLRPNHPVPPRTKLIAMCSTQPLWGCLRKGFLSGRSTGLPDRAVEESPVVARTPSLFA